MTSSAHHRPGRLEHLTEASFTGALTIRPSRLSTLYKIDASDPAHLVAYVPHDLDPRRRDEAMAGIDEALGPILRRRRRAALEPVTELVDDGPPDYDETGTEDGWTTGPILRVVGG